MKNLAAINAALKKYLTAHPWIAGLLACAEATAIATVVDATANGIDFSKNGLKHLLTIVGIAVVVAVRNYLKQSPLPAPPLATVIPFPPPAPPAKE